jgi:prophage regulatory protein
MSGHPLPSTGFLRLPDVLRHIPVSRSAWWAGIQEGRFPAPVKLGPRTTAWRAEDIHELIDRLGRPGQGS